MRTSPLYTTDLCVSYALRQLLQCGYGNMIQYKLFYVKPCYSAHLPASGINALECGNFLYLQRVIL